MKLWAEVQETTGQPFGFELPDGFVYNSKQIRRRLFYWWMLSDLLDFYINK